jgi:TPR repeat protein
MGDLSKGYIFYADEKYDESIKFWEKASSHGELYAFYLLGLMYHMGTGIDVNLQIALSNYRKATNVMEAQINIVNILLKNPKLDEDNELFKTCLNAASFGKPIAQFILGEMYRAGKNVEKDLSKAHQLYELASAQNYQRAIDRLNDM